MSDAAASITSSRRGAIRVALVANAALFAILAVREFSTPATAQSQTPPATANARARGEYTLVSGRLPSGGPHALYVLDGGNQEMVALRWDASRSMLGGIGYRNIATDAAARAGR